MNNCITYLMFFKLLLIPLTFANFDPLEKWNRNIILKDEGAKENIVKKNTRAVNYQYGDYQNKDYKFKKKWPLFRLAKLLKSKMGRNTASLDKGAKENILEWGRYLRRERKIKKINWLRLHHYDITTSRPTIQLITRPPPQPTNTPIPQSTPTNTPIPQSTPISSMAPTPLPTDAPIQPSTIQSALLPATSQPILQPSTTPLPQCTNVPTPGEGVKENILELGRHPGRRRNLQERKWLRFRSLGKTTPFQQPIITPLPQCKNAPTPQRTPIPSVAPIPVPTDAPIQLPHSSTPLSSETSRPTLKPVTIPPRKPTNAPESQPKPEDSVALTPAPTDATIQLPYFPDIHIPITSTISPPPSTNAPTPQPTFIPSVAPTPVPTNDPVQPSNSPSHLSSRENTGTSQPILKPITTPPPQPTNTPKLQPTPVPPSLESGCSGCSENVESLSPERIGILLEAMKNLQNSSDWVRVASIHGEPPRPECGNSYCCVHGDVEGNDGHFLPWHRQYMDIFSSALGTTLPYWDWTTSELPRLAHSAQINNPQTGQFMENPFFKGYQPFDGTNSYRDILPFSPSEKLPKVLATLEEDDFKLFSTQLEEVHDSIHYDLGGTMGYLETSSYDPIFYLHHQFVDLIWAVYQVLKPNREPPDLERTLVPFGRTVGQSLTTNKFNLDINSNRIVFGGMTLSQIKKNISSGLKESGVRGNDIIYAGFIKRSFGISGNIKFNICNGEDCSYPGGELYLFGSRRQMSYINSNPTKVDITNAVKKAGIENINNLKFKIINLKDLYGRNRTKVLFAPIKVIRQGKGGNDIYTIFFNRRYIQTPKLRITNHTIIKFDSSYQNIMETENENSFLNCNITNVNPIPSKTPIYLNSGTHYFFDDDCIPAWIMNPVSKIKIVKE